MSHVSGQLTESGLWIFGTPVEHAHLGHHDGELPDRVAVDIAGYVRDAFVPHDALHILPSIPFQDRVHGHPSEFGVPEP